MLGSYAYLAFASFRSDMVPAGSVVVPVPFGVVLAGFWLPIAIVSALMVLPVAGAVVSSGGPPAPEVALVLAVFESQEARPRASSRTDAFSRFFILVWVGKDDLLSVKRHPR